MLFSFLPVTDPLRVTWSYCLAIVQLLYLFLFGIASGYPLDFYSALDVALRDGATPFGRLWLASDGVFPGTGVPAVASAGASAANAFVTVFRQWQCLDELQQRQKL
mgnify:CR=1 FL=1